MSRYLPMATKERVVNAIITSRLDYCNSLLYGTSVNNIARLQRIHNSAARQILRRPRSSSAIPLLCILHWLTVPQRIEFKLLVFTYKAVHGDASKYLSGLVCPYKPARSLRFRIESTAVMQGVSEEEIQRMGRWKSQAFNKYIRISMFHLQ